MQIFADTHVHVYPRYDLSQFFASVFSSLGAGSAVPVLMLTERFDCFFFQSLLAGSAALPAGYSLAERGPNSARISGPDGRGVVVVAGRQIVTAERLELLVLGRDLVIKDKTPIVQAIGVANSAGALPVVPWSPGKWFGARGKIVDQLISSRRPAELAFSDSALRPQGWALPPLLKKAEAKGFAVLAGSDPLPLAGEEKRAGGYYTAAEIPSLGEGLPLQAIEANLFSFFRDPSAARNLISCGRRLSLASLILTQIRLKLAK